MACTHLPTSRDTELMYITIMSLFSRLHCTDCLIDWLIDLWLPRTFFSVSLPWKSCFFMPSHLIRNGVRCKHTVCNQSVRSFHTHHLPVIWVLRVEPSLQRSSSWNMVFPYCGFISNKDQTQFSFPGAAPGRITQQKKVSVMANTVLLPASAVVSPDAFFFFFFWLHSKCFLGSFFASVPWLFWLLLC